MLPDLILHLKIDCDGTLKTIKCPNSCGKKGLNRDTMRAHLEDECPNEILSCKTCKIALGARKRQEDLQSKHKNCRQNLKTLLEYQHSHL